MAFQLKQYPRAIYVLSSFLLLQQVVYQLSIGTFSYPYLFDETWPESSSFHVLYNCITPVAFFIAGSLTDTIQDVKKGLLFSLVALLMGAGITLIPIDGLFLFGHFIIEASNAVFLFLVLIHISIFFPAATNYKDNAFTIAYFMAAVGLLVGSAIGIAFAPFSLSISSLYSMESTIICVLVGIILFALVFYNKEIGFSISSEGEEKTETINEKWWILGGLTFVYGAFFLAASSFPYIFQYDYLLIDYSGFSAQTMTILIMTFRVVFFVAVIYLLFNMTRHRSNQYQKLMLAFGAFALVALLELAAKYSNNYELDTVTQLVPNVLLNFMLLPLILSILTHVNLGEQTGLWLGILLGVPSLLTTFLFELNIFESYSVAPILAGLMLTLSFLFLRENKDWILEKLKLEEPNQEQNDDEIEKEEDGDIMEHLIG